MQTEPTPPPSIERLRFGGAVRAARRHATMSQAQIALALGVSRRLVSAWECGRAIPDVTQWVRLAEVTSDPAMLDLRAFSAPGEVIGRELQLTLPLDCLVLPARRVPAAFDVAVAV